MKRLIATGLAALIAVVPASAFAGKKAVRQEMQGDVILPAPIPVPGEDGCFTGATRRTALASGGAINGVVGYHFDVDPRTVGKPFQLHVVGGGDDVDLDIDFYDGFGSMDDPTTDPALVAFETREPGGEKGIVPAGYGKIIICMHAGSQASFHYMAGKGVK